MEIVVLNNVPATYHTTWLLIANTVGHDQIKINDEFKEQGTLEIFGVEAVDPSIVPGASRVLVRRGEHGSPVEAHRIGAVLIPMAKPPVDAKQRLVTASAQAEDLLSDP